MRKTALVLTAVLFLCVPSWSAEKKKNLFTLPEIAESKAPAPAAPAAAPAAPAVDAEAGKKLKAIQNQQKWVAQLKKQQEGEAAQLEEMKSSFAQNYRLDPKKLEQDKYEYDEIAGKFVEK